MNEQTRKQLIISIHGCTKAYKSGYVLVNGVWKELILGYLVREMTRSEIRRYLQSKFPEYSVKLIFSKQTNPQFIKYVSKE